MMFPRDWEGIREDGTIGTEVQSIQTREEACSFMLSFTIPEYVTWFLRFLTTLPV